MGDTTTELKRRVNGNGRTVKVISIASLIAFIIAITPIVRYMVGVLDRATATSIRVEDVEECYSVLEPRVTAVEHKQIEMSAKVYTKLDAIEEHLQAMRKRK